MLCGLPHRDYHELGLDLPQVRAPPLVCTWSSFVNPPHIKKAVLKKELLRVAIKGIYLVAKIRIDV